MQTDEKLGMFFVKSAVEDCCCSGVSCDTCAGKECLIGFAKIVSDYATAKKTLTIPNGIKMVPLHDFKTYELHNVAKALAAINIECKNCMDSHDDNCVVNILRSSLEVALTGQHIDFIGNPLSYIMALTQVNSELGNEVMQHYNALRKR